MTRQSGTTKDRLLDAAQDLVQRHGLNAMSFQDLSDAVGIRKASVHHHFANKAEMVDALLKRYLGEFEEVVDDIQRSRASGKTKLKRYCNLFVDTLESGQQDKGCLCGMLMAELLSLDDNAQRLVREFLHKNTAALESILHQGADDGSLAKQKNVKGTAMMILATLEGGLLMARCDGGPARLTEISSRLLQLLSE